MIRKVFLYVIVGWFLFASIYEAITVTQTCVGKNQCCDTSLHLRPIVLSGPDAFYKQPDYVTTTQNELASPKALPPSQIYNFTSPTVRVAKEAFSTILFPWKIYQYLHTAYGNVFFKPSASTIVANKARPLIEVNSEWKYLRFSLLVDGDVVDAIVVGRPSTLHNGRWMLVSFGIGRVYECILIDHPENVCPGHAPGLASLQQLLTKTDSNAICYNYPGMGASAGLISRKAMEKTHEAFLQFLENHIQAKGIIDKGHSYGGANQASAWRIHHAKKNISYVLVKDRSFLSQSDTVKNIAGLPFAIAGRFLGWNIQTRQSSDALVCPEIHVMSVGNIVRSQRFTKPSEISVSGNNSSTPFYQDKVVPYNTSSAIHYLLHPSHQKVIIGVPDAHGASIQDPSVLADAINAFLEKDVNERTAVSLK